MNQHLIRFFQSEYKLQRLVRWLPHAFEVVRNEMPPGNPAVGIMREHVLTGFLIDEFGEDHVVVPDDGVKRGIDVTLHGIELSIKTTTGAANSGVKVLWTVDPLQIGREIARDYKPECDMLLINIFWGKTRKSIYYIPIEVQLETRAALGDKYLHAKVGTNHRGISISTLAMKMLKEHEATISAHVNWLESDMHVMPHDRWVDYWSERN